MTNEDYNILMDALREEAKKASESPEAGRKLLEDSGLIDLLDNPIAIEIMQNIYKHWGLDE